MASPKITFMGINNPSQTSDFKIISQADLLLNESNYNGNGILSIETNHNIAIDNAKYTGGLAIFGTKDGNSAMSATFANGTTISGLGETDYGRFYNIDSTHWLLLISPLGLEEMGQGTESFRVTSTLAGKSTTSFNYFTVDTISPELVSSSPADGGEDVAVDSNITLTFSENVSLGSGTITINQVVGNASDMVITLTDGAVTETRLNGVLATNAVVTVSGKTVTINTDDNLLTNKDYTLAATAGVVKDAAGNNSVAIASSDVNFSTIHIVDEIDLSSATSMDDVGSVDDGEYGVAIFGGTAEQFGTSVSNAGDVNGDGYDDVIIGSAYAQNPYSSSTGLAYVVFGDKNGVGIDIDNASFDSLNDLDGTNGGFIISNSSTESTNLGRSVSTAGDINGDGYADLVVGASENAGTADAGGTAYVIYGQKDGFANVDASTFEFDNGTGFSMKNDGADVGGADPVSLGFSVSTVGDINGDGLADFSVTAPGSVAEQNPGKAFIVYGDSDHGSSLFTGGGIGISTLATGATGFTFDAGTVVASDTTLGSSVSSAGDVNGDGYDDVIVGMAFEGKSVGFDSTGETYVLFRKDDGSFADSADDIEADLTGESGFKLIGSDGDPLGSGDLGDYSGWSVSSAGDFNGDGLDDMVIGSLSGSNAYVVFGKDGLGWGNEVDLTSLAANEGFSINNGAAGQATAGLFGDFAYSVKTAGDVNGDGYDDIIIGERGDIWGAEITTGAAYVIFGNGGTAGSFSDIDLSATALDGTDGFKITGATLGDYLGNAVSTAGDLNGDGLDDLIVGASMANTTAGASYIIYGSEHFGHEIDFMGTAKANFLTGTTAAETFVGGRGNDTLQGKGGADSFKGGQGNDTIKVTDLTFRLVDGGGNKDTLSLVMANKNLDLTTSNNIEDIEVIDLTGTGKNTLTLNKLSVVGLDDNSNTLTVKGNAGDKVDFTDSGWTLDGTVGIYNEYVNGEAIVLIGNAITVV